MNNGGIISLAMGGGIPGSGDPGYAEYVAQYQRMYPNWNQPGFTGPSMMNENGWAQQQTGNAANKGYGARTGDFQDANNDGTDDRDQPGQQFAADNGLNSRIGPLPPNPAMQDRNRPPVGDPRQSAPVDSANRYGQSGYAPGRYGDNLRRKSPQQIEADRQALMASNKAARIAERQAAAARTPQQQRIHDLKGQFKDQLRQSQDAWRQAGGPGEMPRWDKQRWLAYRDQQLNPQPSELPMRHTSVETGLGHPRTMEFRDVNGDGVEDRDQGIPTLDARNPLTRGQGFLGQARHYIPNQTHFSMPGGMGQYAQYLNPQGQQMLQQYGQGGGKGGGQQNNQNQYGDRGFGGNQPNQMPQIGGNFQSPNQMPQPTQYGGGKGGQQQNGQSQYGGGKGGS